MRKVIITEGHLKCVNVMKNSFVDLLSLSIFATHHGLVTLNILLNKKNLDKSVEVTYPQCGFIQRQR